MKRTVSILIPTHNRCRSLARALEGLSHIRFPEQVDAEVIVVANACTDDTEGVVAAAARGMPMPTRCVVEAQIGLNAARNRAAAEARGDILAYLDDDVWVYPDWLLGLCEVYDNEPADLVGGRVLLCWESGDPPASMAKVFDYMMSSSDHGEKVLELPDHIDMVGANFSFSRQTWIKVGRFVPGLDRTGKSLLCGGETEYLRRARRAGLRLFYTPRACVKHWMAPYRIEIKYLRRLAFDWGRSNVFLEFPKPAWHWWLIILGQPFRALISYFGALSAGLAGDKVTALSRHLGAFQRIGSSAGALEIVCNCSPLTKSRNQ